VIVWAMSSVVLMRISEYLISKGVSRPIAIYAERHLRHCALQRLARLKTNIAFEDSGLRDLFQPLAKDVFLH
jgi:hypothetical protein